MTSRLLQGGAVILAAQVMVVPYAAAAQPDPASLIRRTCTGYAGGESSLLRRRLATFILGDQGDIANDPEGRVVAIFKEEATVSRDLRHGVQAAITLLQQQLAADAAAPPAPSPGQVRLAVTSPRRTSDVWLFEPSMRFTCSVDPEDTAGVGTQGQAGASATNIFGRFRLRQSSEALPATGEDRLKAGAAQIGFLRERTILPDGSTRTDSTLSVQGALGFALRDREGSSILIYADYERQRRRSNPPPQLDSGASQSDKDTDILELGITGNQLLPIPGLPIMITGSAAYVANYINDSERIRANISASVNGFFPGGICYFGSFANPVNFAGVQLRGRCSLEILGQVNHVLDAGTATIGAGDEFALAGFRAGMDLATGRSSGVIAGFRYEYQGRLHGTVPSIERFSAHLKYRLWFADDRFGVEFGFEYVDGINPQSFVDEHRTRFGVGLIF